MPNEKYMRTSITRIVAELSTKYIFSVNMADQFNGSVIFFIARTMHKEAY
jgi:hypothetical protein